MANEIKTWLDSSNPDFEAGLKLFTKYSRNRALFLYLSRKQDMRKLRYELEKLSKLKHIVAVGAPKPKSSTAKKSTPPPPDPDGHKVIAPRRVNREDLPKELQEVYDAITDHYKLQRTAHEKMKLAKTDEQRAELRAKLVEIDDNIATGWNTIDEGMAMLAAKAKEKEPATTSADSSKKINTARSAISRAISSKKFNREKLLVHIDVLIQNKVPVTAATHAKLIDLNVIEKESNLLVK